jgi:hypothetical protein
VAAAEPAAGTCDDGDFVGEGNGHEGLLSGKEFTMA